MLQKLERQKFDASKKEVACCKVSKETVFCSSNHNHQHSAAPAPLLTRIMFWTRYFSQVSHTLVRRALLLVANDHAWMLCAALTHSCHTPLRPCQLGGLVTWLVGWLVGWMDGWMDGASKMGGTTKASKSGLVCCTSWLVDRTWDFRELTGLGASSAWSERRWWGQPVCARFWFFI